MKILRFFQVVSFLILFVLSACATAPGTAKNTGPTYIQDGYNFLVEGKISTSGCLAAFEKQGLLYLVTRGGPSFHTTIYNPDNGLFVYSERTHGGYNGVCLDHNFNRIPVMAKHVYAIISPELRDSFDGFKEDPQGLLDAIVYDPPYFKRVNTRPKEGEGEGETMLIRPLSPWLASMGAAENFLRSTGNNEVDKKFAELAERERESQVAKQFYEAKRKEKLRRRAEGQDLWDNRMNQTLNAGDTVCTYESNLFGYVERVEGTKAKVYVVGKAIMGKSGMDPYPGHFFVGNDGSFEYESIEKPRWIDREDLALCKATPNQ